MCLSLPGKVMFIKGAVAVVDYNGEVREASTSFIPDLKEGEYVIISAKMVMQRVPPNEAKAVIELWDKTDEVRDA